MSPKRIGSLASAEVDHQVSLTDNTVSCNGCWSNTVLSESESEFARLRRDRLGVGSEIIARFLAKINRGGPVRTHRQDLGPCWLWTANLVRGYGQFVLPRTEKGQPHVYAHRFAYELVHGLLSSPNIKACHHCDQPRCCRPSHLFPGTQADNLSDARRKGRLVDGAHLIKVDAAGIADIQANYRRGNGKALAAKYGICLVSLLRIVRGTQRVQKPERLNQPPATSQQEGASPFDGSHLAFDALRARQHQPRRG